MNTILVVLLVAVVTALFIQLRKKPRYVGIVSQKEIDTHNTGYSTVIIKLSGGRRVSLVFDTYAKIGCRHWHPLGTSQCFHGQGSELDAMIPKDAVLEVETEGALDYDVRHFSSYGPSILFVHRLLYVNKPGDSQDR